MTVTLFDTREQIELLRPELDRRIAAVIDSGRFILGPEVAEFEKEFASYLGTRHVIGVGNGTDALTLSLRALGVGAGDDVVVPSFTFYATAEAIVNVGATPVFCDIDPDTFNVTAATVERALTPSTSAVVIVHLFGTPAPLTDLRALADRHGIALVEDAAQAPGARHDGTRAGAVGDAASFSFFPSKNLFCLGDGGAIATSRDDVAERARLLRTHGSRDKQTYSEIGFNSRLDAVHAAALRLVLPRLDELNAARRAIAAAYAEAHEEAGLGDLVALPAIPAASEPVHHLFVARSERRDDLIAALDERGIESRSLYRVPVHRQPPMAGFAKAVELPGTDRAAETNFALPIGPTRGPDMARQVMEVVRSALQG